MTRVAQIGNFEPSFSTENELRRALESLGVEVTPLQENTCETWCRLSAGDLREFDFVLWTRTLWDWRAIGSTQAEIYNMQERFLTRARERSVPTVFYHLDRWFGLAREREVLDRAPWTRCQLVCTADGGHQDEWQSLGIDHRWFPPAVSEFECELGEVRPEFECDLAFVGSWNGYHEEWPHRRELVDFLAARGCRFFPPAGQSAIRERALRDLYASARLVVGDSCLVPRRNGSPAVRYCSDRVPETLGRGGCLAHPWVDGVTGDGMYRSGEHLVTWQLGDWTALDELIRTFTQADGAEYNREMGRLARECTLELHTYTVRMRELLETVL